MQNLKEYLTQAKNSQNVLGHFNIADSVMLNAIVAAAKKAGAPAVLVGTSEGERDFMTLEVAAGAVKNIRAQTGFPVFLNADHTKSFERIKAAVDAGYDSVHFDGSALPYEQNVAQTKAAVEYAKSVNPDISVEGELGYIETESSKVYEGPVEIKPEHLTTPEQAAEFAKATGVDRLAVAIGEIHGISLAGNPHLDIPRLAAIGGSVPPEVSITLHGGSGIPAQEIKAALPHGLSNIHISTELRVAYQTALKNYLAQNPTDTTPYKFFAPAAAAIEKLVSEKLALYTGA